MFQIWKYFALSFSALLPLINPLGSALIFLGLVGAAPLSVYRSLARRIAINTILFLVVIDLIGSTLLRFFGISLPIVEVSGGLVIAAIGWKLLNGKDTDATPEKAQAVAQMEAGGDIGVTLSQKTFYPFTFPITAGPGCIVVTLTLGAHMPQKPVSQSVLAHVGFLIALILLSASVYFSYAYAPRIARSISPSTAHGILRVIAFILLCIGVQIAWNGMAILLQGIVRPTA
jgi:multiple antibiotic resistance protein